MLARKPRPPERKKDGLFYDKDHLFHTKVYKWTKMQQFLYGLPDEYSYSVHISRDPEKNICQSKVLIHIGGKTWLGSGKGENRYESLSTGLRDTKKKYSPSMHSLLWKRVRRIYKKISDFFTYGDKYKAIATDER